MSNDNTAKPTAGPARVTRGNSQRCDDGTTIWHSGEWGVYTDSDQHGDDKADADLICEAFNVHTETGQTPRQLVEQRDELLKTSKRLIAAIDEMDRSGDHMSTLDEFVVADHDLRAIIAKVEAKP